MAFSLQTYNGWTVIGLCTVVVIAVFLSVCILRKRKKKGMDVVHLGANVVCVLIYVALVIIVNRPEHNESRHVTAPTLGILPLVFGLKEVVSAILFRR